MSTLLLGKAIKTGPVNDNSSCEFKSLSVAEHNKPVVLECQNHRTK